MLSFLHRFRRVTFNTFYLPEIDGLRFLAIFMVVVVMHIPNYINVKYFGGQWLNEYWKSFSIEGGFGVSLFFIISGFILSLPFARMYLHTGKKVDLKYYYLRRLTRLEPPYLIALILCFIGNVWIVHAYGFRQLLPDLFTSATYLNGPLYHRQSNILPVAWSLEVEVQFYLLEPLLFNCFRIKDFRLRMGLYVALIILSLFYKDSWPFANVFMFFHYFFTGILIADLYCHNVHIIKGRNWGVFIGVLSLASLFAIRGYEQTTGYVIKLVSMFFLVHLVLSNTRLKRLFSLQMFTIIGGMCYSIYLLHFAIISAVGRLLEATHLDHDILFIIISFIVFIVSVLIASAVYFLYVEKPFMKSIDFRKASAHKDKSVTNI